jgi:hypothetical protein
MDAGGVFAIIFAILFLVVGALYAKTFVPNVSVPSVRLTGVTDFMSLLVLYMPNVFFVYGFIADIVNNKYHYSVASLTALFGMVINRVLGLPVANGVSFIRSKINTKIAAPVASALTSAGIVPVAPQQGGEEDSMGLPPLPVKSKFCSLPGFEWLENTVAPQGIIMSMTVLWYLMIEMWDTGQGQNTIALGVTTLITFGVQWFVLYSNGCLKDYIFQSWSPITALIMSITFAGTSYGIQKVIARNVSSGGSPVSPVPSATPGTFVCPPGTVQSADGTQCVTPLGPGGIQPTPTQSIINVGGKNAQSEPVDDNDQFVCEAYKDGELVTSTIVE